MTQPIQPDRTASPVRDHPHGTRDASSRSTGPTEAATAAGTPDVDTANVSQGSALLRSASLAPGSGAIGNAEEARALAARISEALRGDPSRAMQAYRGARSEDVQALLATV